MIARTIQTRDGDVIHVETALGIVNIRTGLHDRFGRRVEAVSMIPNEYEGEPVVRIVGNRFVELKGGRRWP